MADYTITVSYSTTGGVSVDIPNLSVPYDPGVTKTIEWVRSTGATFTLKSVIFLRPVGKGFPLGIPTGDGASITVTDDNSNPFAQADRFKYLLLIDDGGAVIPSPDPEIVNEPQGGLGGMDGDDGGG